MKTLPRRCASAGKDKATIDKAVRKAAELLKLTPYLDRTPLNLSGGQQQRTALARAIVKNASLVLLDEPLANLDYKLREELREELPKIFAESGAIFVYATTEPSEALLLGGNTATLSQGRITPVRADHFRLPQSRWICVTARTFARSTAEHVPCRARRGNAFRAVVARSSRCRRISAFVADGPVTIAFHPHHLSLCAVGAVAALNVRTLISEITGSESFIHVELRR